MISFEHELHELYEWFYVDDNLRQDCFVETKVVIIWKHLENKLSECFKTISTYHLHKVLFIFVFVRFVVLPMRINISSI